MTELSAGLIGFFGWGNFGDELFVSQWQETLGARARPVNDLLGKPYFSRPVESVLAEFDALVIGGGDLVRTESISQLYWNRAWKSKPLVVSGIGVAAESGRTRADIAGRLRAFLLEARVLSFSVRDNESRKWIEEHVSPDFPVDVVPDLGFASLGGAWAHEGPSGVPVVGLVFNKNISESDQQVRRMLLDLEQGGEIRLRHLVLATGEQRGQEETALENAGVPKAAVEGFDSLPEMIAAVAECDFLVSAKFHGLVASLANGRPCWSLKATSKACALMSSVGLPTQLPESAEIRQAILSRPQLNEFQRSQILGFREGASAELVRVKKLLSTGTEDGLFGQVS